MLRIERISLIGGHGEATDIQIKPDGRGTRRTSWRHLRCIFKQPMEIRATCLATRNTLWHRAAI